MAIEILGADELAAMRRAGRAAAATLATVGRIIRPGIATSDIDALVRHDTAARGAKPSQLGYCGFPAAVCTSRNEVACHGIPRPAELLEDGDIISVDVTSNLGGFHGDTCATFAVGDPSERARALIGAARRCRDAGIRQVRAGARLGDIGAAIQREADEAGVQVVTVVGGHGIGREMHLDPHVSNVGRPGRGLRLRAGMCITIEPILTLGTPDLVEDADGWTLRTADGRWAAQFEHTVLVTEEGPEVLTLPAPP